MKTIPKISETEWEVMKVLWTESPLPADDIIARLAAQDDWHRHLVQAGPVIDVDEVDPRGLDADERLARPGRGVRNLLVAQRLVAAGRVDANGLHDPLPAGASGKATTVFLMGLSVFR